MAHQMSHGGAGLSAADEIRSALIEAARAAYEDAGVSGLCAEGRWEAAVSALRSAELGQLAPPADAVTTRTDAAATLADFAAAVAAPTPTPGGGSVAAAAAMLAAALARMVATLTARDRRYADVEPEMRSAAHRVAALGAELEILVARDAGVAAAVVVAYRSRAGTEADAEARFASIERALVEATEVPLEIARAAAAVAELGAFVAEHGKAIAVSEAGAAAVLAEAACRAAGFAVRVNVASLHRARSSGLWSRYAEEAAMLAAGATRSAQRAAAAVEAACTR